MEKNRFCIVDYENKEPYSKLKDVNALNESRIREAKEKREKLSGENFHEKQCLSVPDMLLTIRYMEFISPPATKYSH